MDCHYSTGDSLMYLGNAGACELDQRLLSSMGQCCWGNFLQVKNREKKKGKKK